MNKQQAQQIIKDTFEHSFDMDRFTVFIKNLLNRIDESKAFHAHGYVKEGFRSIIKTYERVGTYNAADDKKVDIIVVYLQKGSSLDHARVTQRNFAGRYLDDRGEKDAGLFAFVSPDEADWRFSLVKMDYKFDKNGKVKEEFTPARRWSFLVGANEKSHTAQSRLVNILAEDEKAPTLQEIENAFDIETVTKEFFLKYRELFLRTKEELDRVVEKDSKVEADFKDKGVDTVNFAKKLLGQIIFLYFLQKKGWFGVGRDNNWGTGSKHFLRELFKKKHSDYNNFFNDILEPLFYEALRSGKDREHIDYYYSRFNCKIPFLNGGLFDPIGNYDWVHTDIIIPDTLFSNKTENKEGDGILDIFDLYNFTVKEDEPLEKEVAIDPELLGKAYEKFNAIRPDNFEEYKKALKSGKKGDESKFNKQFGVYYTPREIVHYMCQQSLINYLSACLAQAGLATDLSSVIPSEARNLKKDIEALIHTGEHVSENEARVISEGRETRTYSHKLPENIRKNAALIDQKLAEITVCDPAVGSGAFPVGMMSEIVKARIVLTTFLPVRDRTQTGIEYKQNRKLYDFKRRCIEHSLYGVDIDPGAVEIAKLRLWLSLVVDEDDIKNIKPLPNLDYKIVCGNSLLGVEKNLFNFNLFNELEKLKPQFFNETNPTKKQGYKKQIDDLIIRISSGHTEFDFEVYFSEIFHKSGVHSTSSGQGFDVVIANPPYVRQESIRDLKPHLARAFNDFYCGTADIYTYFYKCGIDLLKPVGHLCFIAPNKFMRAGYGKNTRVLLSTQVTPKLVIDFGDLPIFDATTYPSILLVEKRKPDAQDMATAATFMETDQLGRLEETLDQISFPMPVASLKKEGWNLERPTVLALMEKLRSQGIPLGEYVQGFFYRGVVTGCNEAFVIDEAKRKELISNDPKCDEIIKPFLQGRNILKWKANLKGQYLLYIPWHFAISKHPAILRHLENYRGQLEKRSPTEAGRYEWYALQRYASDYHQEFEKPKIVWGNLSTEPKFAYDNSAHYVGAPANIIPTNDLYLLAILNSPLCKWWISLQAAVRAGGFLEYKPMYVSGIPVFQATDAQKAPIIERTLAILADPNSPAVPHLEAEINNLIYVLYNLNSEEIDIIEKV